MLQKLIGRKATGMPDGGLLDVGRRSLSQALGLTLNLRQHLLLSRLLGCAGALDRKVFYPGIRYRYLRSFYLGGGFSFASRLRIAINHYQSLARHFEPGFLLSLQNRSRRIWGGAGDALGIEIELRFPARFNHDGDLCLILRADGDHLYQLTFSIAPGEVAGERESQVLLVAGIQGRPGKIDQIRRVTEVCGNVAPVRLLLMAAKSFATALGISAIVGVGQRHMTRPKPGVDEGFSFDYDAFWMTTLDVAERADFYYMPLPFPLKPIESVPAKHRARARQRRAQRDFVRQDIQRQSHAGLAPSLLP